MITAHLPTGYVAARLGRITRRAPFWALMAGSGFPDLDLIWFYLIDDRAFHHHNYWVHIPGFWLALAIVTLPLIRMLRPALMPVALAFLAGIAVHLALDTIAGSVAWGWPFTDHLFEFVTVPATHANWIVSFLTHWTFAFELSIWLLAGLLYVRRDRSDPATGQARSE